jgi:hypothetical protein
VVAFFISAIRQNPSVDFAKTQALGKRPLCPKIEKMQNIQILFFRFLILGDIPKPFIL